jgi:alanine dehydrogenase
MFANEGVAAAVERHPSLRPGVNTRDGEIVNATVAAALAG